MAEPARADLLLEGILHPGEVDRFVSWARPTTTGEIADLRRRTLSHMAEVAALGRREPRVDVDTARRIADVLAELCDRSDELTDDQRALLRGAIEYFVQAEDEVGDTDDVVGFDDDARVVNAVTAALGRRDLRIEVA